MKTTNKYLGFASMAGVMLAMGSCATEPNFQPSQAGIPQASDYQIGISVDELNNVELNILDKDGNPAKGVYPIWYVNESTRPSTKLTYRDLITIAGDYPVEMKVGNGNGVSDGSVTGNIHIDKTIFDFTPYMRGLTNGETKEWAVNGEVAGNMGCGETPDNPTGWWSATPNQKEAEGVYANVLTFGDNGEATTGSYTYDPGTSGTFYVNTGVQSLPGYTFTNPNDGQDFRVDAHVVETTFALVPEGANLYLTLPADTPFPYIPSEAAFAAPKYRIANFSRNEITLVQDLDGISWQYIIAPKADADVTTSGFKYDYEHNLWKGATINIEEVWFADDSWNAGAVAQPEVIMPSANGFQLHVPAGTGSTQWQGQVKIVTDIAIQAGVAYDFSCNVNVPKAGAVTVKVQKLGDNDTFFTDARVDVEPNGSIVWFSDVVAKFDGDLKIVFDFAGYGDCDVAVSNIVFKEHQYDDGTIIPAAANAPQISDADNLFANYEIVKYSTWFADSSWSSDPITQPEIIFFPGGYSFITPEEAYGNSQWQGQVHVWTNIKTSAENKYDFVLTIESDRDIKGVTVKIQKGDVLGEGNPCPDDDTAFSTDQVDVEAGVPYTYFFKNKPGFDTTNLQVCMDYAGAPNKTNITVSDIRMQIAK